MIANMTERIKLFVPNKIDVAYRAGTKDSVRNCLGTFPSSETEAMIQKIELALTKLGIPFYFEQYHRRELRFSITTCEITNRVNELTKANRLANTGIFIEDVFLSDGTKDTSQKMIWIYFTVQYKALTYFRKWLLDNIFELKELDDIVFVVKDSMKENEVVIQTREANLALQTALDQEKCTLPRLEVLNHGVLVDGCGNSPKDFKRITARFSQTRP